MELKTVFFVFVFSVFLTLVGCQLPEDKVDQLSIKLQASSTQEEKTGIIDKVAKIEHNRASSLLLRTLDDINYRDIHKQVILALGKVRPTHIQTIPKLLEKSSDLAFRDDVIRSLLLIGPEAISAVVKNLEAEKDIGGGQLIIDEETRNSAFYVLSEMGTSAATEVLKLLKSKNTDLRNVAITLIGDIAANSDSVDTYILKLIEVYSLDVTDMDRANTEFQLLSEAFAKIGDPAIPHLTEALEDEKLQVKIGSALALYPIDKTKQDVILSILIEALGDDNAGPIIAMKLADFGQSILPNLEKAFNSDDYNTYQNAAVALGKMGTLSLPIFQHFIGDFVSKIFEEFDQATLNRMEVTLSVLLTLGKEAKPLTADLIKILAHQQFGEDAAGILGRIGESTVPNLIQLLKSKDNKIRSNAAYALGQMRTSSPQAKKSLFRMLKDPAVSTEAAYALANIGNSLIQKTVDFSIGCWINPSGQQKNWATIFSNHGYSTGQPRGVAIEQMGDAVNTFRTQFGDGESFGELGVVEPMTNQWNHIVATRKGKTGTIYLNGKMVSQNETLSENPILSSEKNLYIGNQALNPGNPGSGNQYFNGLIDEVFYSNKSLNQEQILTIMNKGLGNSISLVSSSWFFEKGTGNKVFNTSSKAYDGVLLGNPKRVKGKFGKALSLDGVGDMVEISSDFPIREHKLLFSALKKGFLQSDFDIKTRAIETIAVLGKKAIPFLLDLAKETQGTLNEGMVAQLLSEHSPVETLLNLTRDGKSSWKIRRASYEGLKVQKSTMESEDYQGPLENLPKIEDGIVYFEGLESIQKLVKSLDGKMTQMQLQKLTDESVRVGADAVPFLIEAFNSKVPKARGRASSILVEIGQEAVPALKTASRIGGDKEIYWAELTLKKIGK